MYSLVDVEGGTGWEWKLVSLAIPIGSGRNGNAYIYEGSWKLMMIYRTKWLALEAASSDEVAVRVEGGWMIMSMHEYRVWKRQR